MAGIANLQINIDARSAINDLRRFDNAVKSSHDAIDNLVRQAAGVGLALVGGFAIDRIIRDVSELDQNIRRLGTVGMDIAKISPAIKQLSADLGGVANSAELAAASYQAASAGFSDTAGNIKILNAATRAAVGGLADTQAVTEVLVKTLNAYGMSGSRAFEVTDSISKAVELGNQEWSDYTALLGRVVSTSSLAGVSIDQLNAFIAAATKNGATAEVAFTGLSGVLNTLLQPTKESQEAAQKLGIAWNYGGLQARGFTGLMADLAKAMDKDKETTARLLGSQEAMRGAFAANAKSGKDFKMILEELSKASGKTDADFQTMRGSLKNTTKALDTSFQNLSESLIKAFGPAIVLSLQDLTKATNRFAETINAIPQPVFTATGELIKFAAQLFVIKKAIDAVIALRVAYVGAIGAMGAATAATGTAATAGAGAFALYTRNAQVMAATANAATPKLIALRGVLASLANMAVIAIAVNIAVYGMSEVIAARNELDRLRGSKGGAKSFGGSATLEQKKTQKQVLGQIAAERQKNIALQGVPGLIFAPNILQNSRNRILDEREKSALAILALPTRRKIAPAITAPPALGATVGGIGRAGGGRAGGAGKADKAASDRERTAQLVAESAQSALYAREQFKIFQRTLSAQRENNQQLIIARETQKDLLGIARQIDDVRRNKDLPEAAKINELEALRYKAKQVTLQFAYDIGIEEEKQAKAVDERLANLKALAEQYGKNLDLNVALTAEQEKQKILADTITSSVGQGLTTAFNGLIQGTEEFGSSLRKIASGVLVDIANQLMRIYVINQITGLISNLLGPKTSGFMPGTKFNPASFAMPQLAAGLPARAMGGPVTAGQPYLVGERGPELFVPSGGGNVLPSGKGGGNVTVNVSVDATGSQVAGDNEQASQLGRVIAAAVQSELIKAKRPGGILNS